MWVVDPRLRSVTVHTPGGEARLLMGGAALEGGDVLPGFRVELEALLAAPPAMSSSPSLPRHVSRGRLPP